MNTPYEIVYKQNNLTIGVVDSIDRNVKLLMDYFYMRLEDEEFTFENVNFIFKEIVNSMGCMRYSLNGDKFTIHYNRNVDILIEGTKIQIYRNLKLQKILK